MFIGVAGARLGAYAVLRRWKNARGEAGRLDLGRGDAIAAAWAATVAASVAVCALAPTGTACMTSWLRAKCHSSKFMGKKACTPSAMFGTRRWLVATTSSLSGSHGASDDALSLPAGKKSSSTFTVADALFHASAFGTGKLSSKQTSSSML